MTINIRIRSFFCFIILTPIFIFSHEDWRPNQKQKNAFEQVLRHLLSNTEIGYVVYGEKPVWLERVPSRNGLLSFFARREFLFSFLHRFASYIDRLAPTCSGNIIIKRFENQIYFINKRAFLKAVSNNLTLFQYILGPRVAPESLLNELLNPKQSLLALLNHQPALIGIVLGYGAQNALFGARSEWLHEKLWADPVYPLVMPESKIPLLKKNYPGSSLEKEFPSFGFSSLQEESDFIHKKLFLSTQYKEQGFPSLPVFSCLDSQESDEILDRFAQAREKIRNLLSSDQLFESFFKDCEIKFREIMPIDCSKTCDKKVVLSAIPTLFDRSCASSLEQHDVNWQTAFLEGLQQEPSLISSKEFVQLSLETDAARKAFLTAQHQNKARLFFEQLQKRNDLICVAPGKLYYKIIEPGIDSTDGIVTEASSLALSYALQTISEEKPALGCYEKVAISDFQPGVILCMLGMKVGERREIWIHPDYSNGIDAAYRGTIQILQSVPLENPAPVHTAPILSISSKESELELKNRFLQLQKKTAFAFASAVKHMLQYSLDPEEIVAAFSKSRTPRELSPSEEEMIFSFYLSLYENQQKAEESLALEEFSHLPSSAACIIKDRLYVERLKEGTGPLIKKDSKITLRRRLKNHSGLVLSETSSRIDLKNSIKAFKTALPGQRVGSKIRLFIHPDYGFKESVERTGDRFLISELEILPDRTDTERNK
jgi:FKBP-type peptidyl-prolyl cis-trans isomerase